MASLPADAGNAGIFLVVGVMSLIAVGILTSMIRSSRIAETKIQLLAEQLKGQVNAGLFLERSSLSFRIHGYGALFSFGEAGREFTRISVRIPTWNSGRLILIPESMGGQFHRLFGVQDIRIGDRRFDQEFIIQAQPEAAAHRVFDPSQRLLAMEAVRRVSRQGRFMVRAETGRLEVQLHHRIMDGRVLMEMVRTATELVQCMTATLDTGIVWGESAEQGDGHCPVCTTALAEPLVRCKRCGVPHHRECWDYLGRCAVFGCEPRVRRELG